MAALRNIKSTDMFTATALLRAALTQSVYSKALKLPIATVEASGSGALASYVSLDITRIVDNLQVPYIMFDLLIMIGLGEVCVH